MLNIPGRRAYTCEGPTRRELMRIGSIGLMGLSLPHFFLWRDQARAAEIDNKYAGARGWESAKSVIMVFLQGGPSHIDIWDPKPDAPANIRGEFKPIKTKIPGAYDERAYADDGPAPGQSHSHPLHELYAQRPV